MRFPTFPAAIAAVLAFLPTPAAAQRHLWLVPGTSGLPFEGVAWDRAGGRIIAASGDAILGIDPVTGARKVLHRTRREGGGMAGPGPRVLDLVLGEDGRIDFTRSGPSAGTKDGRIWRLEPDGEARVIAGRTDEGDFVGTAEDARNGRFQPTGLAAGPDGERYVADETGGRVLCLEPQDGGRFSLRILAGAGPAPGPGYDLETDDWDGEGNGAAEHAYLGEDSPAVEALAAGIRPRALAAAPDGSVFFADWSLLQDGRPPWVFQLTPAETGEPGWRMQRLPQPILNACECPPGQGALTVRRPHRLAVDDEGTVTILGDGLIWSYAPLETFEGEDPDPQWRCEVIAGPVVPKQPVDDWPPQGAPGDQLDPDVLGRIRHLAPVSGGGLLLTDGVDGIRFLGPPGDAALGSRVRAHARARTEGDGARAQAILDALERQRDGLATAPFDLPFRRLCKAATVSSRLDEDVLEVIGSFLAEPRVLAFRAGMAAQAIRAGGDAGPDPREQALARRHVWQVPGTHRTRFTAMAWDPGTGTLVAAAGGEIRRLDPARGGNELLHPIPPAPAEGATPAGTCLPGPLSGREVQALAAGPDGAIDFSTVAKRWVRGEGRIWRLTPQGGLRLLAGGQEDLVDAGLDPLKAGLHPDGMASGPGGTLYVADVSQDQVLRLTPGGDARPAGIQRITDRLLRNMGCIALGEGGDVLVGCDQGVSRLRPAPGTDGTTRWIQDWLPYPGTGNGPDFHDPFLGGFLRTSEVAALAPGQNGAFFIAAEGELWEYTPEKGPHGERWRIQVAAVAQRHLRADGRRETDAEFPLPILPDSRYDWCDLAAIPGGGLVHSGSQDGGIQLIGPPGDGALFDRVRAFQEADVERDPAMLGLRAAAVARQAAESLQQMLGRTGLATHALPALPPAGSGGAAPRLDPKARRILGALLRQRRLTDQEAFDLPFLALAQPGPGGAAPRLGPLPRPVQRLVGSFLVRPRVIAFRAAVAAETILHEAPWARCWVAAGCPGDEPAAADAAKGAKRQRSEASDRKSSE